MQVMDIVNRAVMSAGIVQAFNPDEVPEDIQARGSDILRHEIIPNINCDRSLDITEVVYKALPKQGKFDLITPPNDYKNIIVGSVEMSLYEFCEPVKFVEGDREVWYPKLLCDYLLDNGYVVELGNNGVYLLTEKWPTDNVGKPIGISIWTCDHKLIELDSVIFHSDEINEYRIWLRFGGENKQSIFEDFCNKCVNKLYNIEFTPMRVEEVYRASDGAPLNYLHAGELISSEFRYAQLAYTIEDLPNLLRIRFTRSFGNNSVLLILPIPIRVINSYQEPRPWYGTIIAPDKFKSYLVNKLAYRMAIEYGVSTAPVMEKLAAESYQSLIKNLSKRHHAQDIPRKIFSYLERGRGWRAGANGSGYVGGYNG